MSYSVASPFHQSETPRPIERVEPMPAYSAEAAGSAVWNNWAFYDNPYSAAIRDMFAEADQYVPEPFSPEEEALYGSDTEVYREVMETMYRYLDESDVIKKFRSEGFQPSSEHEIQALFHAFDRALEKAIEKTPMSDKQEARLKFQARSELDWSLRDVVIHRALGGGFDELDFMHIIDPNGKRIEWMNDKQILGTLRRSGNLTNADTVKARLKADHAALDAHADLPSVKAVLSHPEAAALLND